MEQFFVVVAALFGSGGAGALGVKYMLNGSREAIRRIEGKTDKISDDIVEVRDRVSRIEGKVGL